MSRVVGLPIADFRLIASILKTMGEISNFILKDTQQKGGILCVSELDTGLPLITCVFGNISENEHREYMAFAFEKAERLSQNSNHYSSYQSRDTNASPKKYGGAIRANCFILSFSGFEEDQDEAAVLVLAMKVGEMDGGPAALIAQMSGNEYFRKLQNEFFRAGNVLDRFQFCDEKHA